MALFPEERESYIEERVVKHARRKGWYCRKFTSPNHKAVPDYLFMKYSMAFLIEFKNGKTLKATDLQVYEHERLAHFGMDVRIINDIQKGKELIAEWDALVNELRVLQVC
jgi:hypothetical protein